MGLSALDLVNLAQEPITNDEELWHACSGLFNIQVPRHQVCDCCCAPFDALSHAFFAKSPVAVWVGGRGTGKTLMLALLCSLEMVNLEVNCKLIAGSKDQADLVIRYLRREDADITGKLWDSPTAPSLLIDHSVDNKSRLQHVDKWKIEALASSEAAIRGHHPHRLRFDECDVAIRSIIESSTGLTKDKTTPRGEILQRAQTVYSSTYHNPRGTMWWLLEKAKTEGWPVFRWCVAKGQMVTTLRGQVPIEEVTTEDKVLTRKGWKRVQHVTHMGDKQTVKLRDNTGRELVCTGDHRVAVGDAREWLEASLTPGSVAVSLLDANTLSADSISPVWSDPSILSSKSVSLRTRFGSLLVKPGTPLVFGVGDDFKMSDVAAGLIPTQVGEGESFRDKPLQYLPDAPMDRYGRIYAGGPTQRVDSVSAASSFIPQDAASGNLNDSFEDPGKDFRVVHTEFVSAQHHSILPVYDIGVEDCHEFVVNGFVVHNCYKEALQSKGGWMPDDFIERKKKEVPHHRWLIEYENCEPAGGTRIWTREKLDRIFLRALGEMEGKQDDYFRAWGHRLPPQNRRYFHGIDWAKVKDDTVLTTFTPQDDFHQCVGWYRMNKIDYDEQLARVAYHIRTHPGDTCHDATTYGQTMHDFLKNHPMLKQYYQSSRAGLEGINFSAQRRLMEVLSKYIKAVEDEKVYFPMIQFLYEEHAYLNDEQITGQKHMPDSLVSAMLAYEASQMFQIRRTTPRPRFIRF